MKISAKNTDFDTEIDGNERERSKPKLTTTASEGLAPSVETQADDQARPADPAADRRLVPYTRFVSGLIRFVFILSPSWAIAYLYFFSNPVVRFVDHGFHEVAIGIAVSLSAFVALVTWRYYRDSGEPFLHWVAQGMTGFTVIYLPHGLLTRAADHNLWRFLLYGPVSRVVMVGCLFVGLFRYADPLDSAEERRKSGPLWRGMALFILTDVLVALAAESQTPLGPWLRIIAENGAVALAVLCIALMIWRGIDSPLMQLYLVAMAFFAQSSLSFLLAKPWDHQWWMAHLIFAGGFLVLSYGVLQAFHTTRSFVTVYSQEEMMRRLQHANAELERLAATDALTGAVNRRQFMWRFEEELARADRDADALSLLMIDIDFFKSVNDEHGHQAGDATLVRFVEQARDILRSPDLLGRFGGEEFSVLLPKSTRAQAAAVAERIRSCVEQFPINSGGSAFRVTVSIGVAELGHDGTSVEHLLKAADDRLYAAKAAGRNRVCA